MRANEASNPGEIIRSEEILNKILDDLNDPDKALAIEDAPRLIDHAVSYGLSTNKLSQIWLHIKDNFHIGDFTSELLKFFQKWESEIADGKRILFSSLSADSVYFFHAVLRVFEQHFLTEDGELHTPRSDEILFVLDRDNYTRTLPNKFDLTYNQLPSEAEKDFDFYRELFQQIGLHEAIRAETALYKNTCKEYKSPGYVWGEWTVYNERARACFYQNYPHLLHQRSEITIPLILDEGRRAAYMSEQDVCNVLYYLDRVALTSESQSKVESLTLICDKMDSATLYKALSIVGKQFTKLQSLTLTTSNPADNLRVDVSYHFSEIITLIKSPNNTLRELNLFDLHITEKELIALEEAVDSKSESLTINFNPLPEANEAYNCLMRTLDRYQQINSDEVVATFFRDLREYRNGLLFYKTDELADRHAGRVTQFLQKLKDEAVVTREELESAIKKQMDLWLNKDTYSKGINLDEVLEETSDFSEDKLPKKHAQPLYRRDYGNYFYLLANGSPDLKLAFFIKLYTAQMKGEITLQKEDIGALKSFCQVPEQAEKFEEAFQEQLIASDPMRIAFEKNKRIASDYLVRFALGNFIAPSGMFAVNPQTITEERLESLSHHAPYIVLGISAALVLALNGGVFAFAMTVEAVAAAKGAIHVFDEIIHVVKAFIHGYEAKYHAHIPELAYYTKKFLRVEADTQDQINYFNASMSESLKDPAEMLNFSKYVRANLSGALPLAKLSSVSDTYHTHISEIKTLTTFILCVSCMNLGYLPAGNEVSQTDEQFLNKLMFVVAYLGPSVQDIKQHLKGEQTELKRGLIKASYEKENGEKVAIKWRWNAGMSMSVKPHNRNDAVTFTFDDEIDNVEHDAMPFELALMKSLLDVESHNTPTQLPELPGVEFNQTEVPQLSNEAGEPINSNEQAFGEFVYHLDKLKGIESYAEYRSTQARLSSLESSIAQHEGALAEHTETLGAQAEQLELHDSDLYGFSDILAGHRDRLDHCEEGLDAITSPEGGKLQQLKEIVDAQRVVIDSQQENIDRLLNAIATQARSHADLTRQVNHQQVQINQLLQHNNGGAFAENPNGLFHHPGQELAQQNNPVEEEQVEHDFIEGNVNG